MCFCVTATSTSEIYTFPYTTLFRSRARDRVGGVDERPGVRRRFLQASGDADDVDFLRRRRGLQQEQQEHDEHRHGAYRSEEHTSELQSLRHLVCRLLLETKKT